jgi:hypothetical protein
MQPAGKNEIRSKKRDEAGSDYDEMPMSLWDVVFDNDCVEGNRCGGEPELLVANIGVVCVHGQRSQRLTRIRGKSFV